MTDNGELHARKKQYAKVPSELIHDKRISSGAVRCYAHMHWRYGNNHRNFEGRQSIAKYLGVSERAISGYIKELEAHGWIVVVQRKPNAETKQYQTPYYHIFESRGESFLFREAYKPTETERLRPVPTLKTEEKHKSRAGIGGKPSHKPHENSSSSGNQVNSSSPRHVNSSSHYPDAGKDSLYPDAVKERDSARDSTPVPFHIANGLGRTAPTDKTPLIKAVEGFEVFKAYARGWDEGAPALSSNIADIALHACHQLEADVADKTCTLEEIEATTRWKLSLKTTTSYPISFVKSDIPIWRKRSKDVLPKPKSSAAAPAVPVESTSNGGADRYSEDGRKFL